MWKCAYTKNAIHTPHNRRISPKEPQLKLTRILTIPTQPLSPNTDSMAKSRSTSCENVHIPKMRCTPHLIEELRQKNPSWNSPVSSRLQRHLARPKWTRWQKIVQLHVKMHIYQKCDIHPTYSTNFAKRTPVETHSYPHDSNATLFAQYGLDGKK